jgi:flagellar basal-body rod protein FlgF
MNMMVRLAMSGAKETMLAQAVNTHNLANASTVGFRSDLIRFSGENVGESMGSRMSNSIDFTQGLLRRTGNTLDVAIDGDGWMVVQTADGSEAYTRRGDLRIDSTGRLTNGSGNIIMGNGGPIAIPPFGEIEIGSDGTISIQPIGQTPTALAIVDRIRLVTLDDAALVKSEDGFLRLSADEEAVPDASLQLLSGTLEGSNVNPIEAMVRMIDLARKFESQIKMMQTSEENDQTMSSVLRIS